MSDILDGWRLTAEDVEILSRLDSGDLPMFSEREKKALRNLRQKHRIGLVTEDNTEPTAADFGGIE